MAYRTEPVPGLIGEHCACPGEPRGMSLRVRLMIAMWIPASAGMTETGAGCGFLRAGTGTRPYDYGRGQATVPVRVKGLGSGQTGALSPNRIIN